jgi:hypothetical protein
MIGLFLIATGLVGYWAWKTRETRAMRFGDVAAVVAALIGLQLFRRHDTMLALLAIGGAGWWYWWRRQVSQESAMTPDQASRLLDVPPDASAETIRAAHRRLVARVHPDAGGSADLTAQVNEARDTLLKRRQA